MSFNFELRNKPLKKINFEQKQKIDLFLKNGTKKEIIDFYKKTDLYSINKLFEDSYETFVNIANPKYGKVSENLFNDLKNTKKEDFIIITLRDEDIFKENIDLKKIQTFPFNKIFVQTSLIFEDENKNLMQLPGVIISKDKEGKIRSYVRSVDIRKQIQKNLSCFEKDEKELNLKLDSEAVLVSEILYKLIQIIAFKFNTHKYKTYFQYENGNLKEKRIIYASDVREHKRHFWKDSGRFKIPLMKQNEWEEKGYGTDELVFKDGELRKDIPYKIIGQALRNKELKKENRRISLIKKRIWKSEQKVYEILLELFPNNYIRRHDRKTLNGLELDFNLPELRLGVEYDGEQHFDRKLCEEVFKSDFDAQVRRDREKNKRCGKKNITLIRIKYDEPLTKTHLKKKLRSFIK